MIEDSKVEGKKVYIPDDVLGDEKFVWVLMNWWTSENDGQPLLKSNYASTCAKAKSLSLPLTSIVAVNLSNNWYVDYETPANDNQLKYIKANLSVYTNSVCVAFTNASGTETPENAGNKISFYLEQIGKLTGLPVIAWITDTNMDEYIDNKHTDELPHALENRILAMFYDKAENVASVNPPAPTDYDAKNYFYVYGDRVLSRVSESITATLLGVTKLGTGEVVVVDPEDETPEDENPGTGTTPGTTTDAETKAAITGIYKIMNWFAKKLGYTE